MQEEVEALHKNKTQAFVKLPNGKAVGCKQVFTVKHKADGATKQYKARLVAIHKPMGLIMMKHLLQ